MRQVFVHAFVDPGGVRDLRNLRDVQVTVREVNGEPVEWSLPEHSLEANIHMWTFPPANLAAAHRLELIQITSAGYNQLHGLDLVRKGIRACNASGVHDPTIAEWNVAMMINLARNLREMIRHQEIGTWERREEYQREIRHLTVGLWGYGGIARATARLCKALGMRVWALTRDGIKPRDRRYREPGTGDPEGRLPDQVFVANQRDEFLSQLDFLILCVPLNEETAGMMGEHELSTLSRRAFILNPARGPLIREAALLKSLEKSWIAGAALDTHYQYPMPADHPLWSFPQVIMTPHISGSTASPHFKKRLWDLFVRNVRRHLSNQPLLNELSREQLARN